MKNRELSRQIQRLQSLIKKTSEACGSDLELQAHWARYLCVQCAGFLENSLSEMYGDYAKSKSNDVVAQYVAKQLERIQNPNSEKYIQTAYAFNKVWGDGLKVFLEQEGRKDAIDTIMANRNRIAHGEDSGITILRIKEYLSKIIEVVRFIETQNV